VVTGVAQTSAGRKLPLRRQKLIADAEKQLRLATTNKERLTILKTLIGRVFEAAQVDPETWNGKAQYITQERQAIERQMRQQQDSILPGAGNPHNSKEDGGPWISP
jgi:RNA-directed DNA polymerase